MENNVDMRHGRYEWQRAKRCASSACVEIARTGHSSLVRDSKDAGGPILEFSGPTWAAFVDALRAGEFGVN